MKILIITVLIFVLSGPVFACDDEPDRLRYNAMEDEFSYAAPQDRLKYNPLADEWTYEDPDSRLRYNPHEDRFEYAR